MIHAKVITSHIHLLIISLCISAEAYYLATDAEISTETEDFRYESSSAYESTDVPYETSKFHDSEDAVFGFASENAGNKEVNGTKGSAIENLNELLNPFLSFPFFPFHLPNLKRDVFRLNSTETSSKFDKVTQNAGNQPVRKPFFFMDFEFNIRKIPLRNQTSEIKDGSVVEYHPKAIERVPQKVKTHQNDAPLQVVDDDWSFFDDTPLLPPEMDEFLPKSDFLFFDFPFHRKQSKKLSRSKRDNPKPHMKNDINFIVDIFDEAISRTKKEMEGSAPIWGMMSQAGKSSPLDGKRSRLFDVLPQDETKSEIRDAGKHWGGRGGLKGEKRSPYEAPHHKNPVILGKVVEIGEIHFGNDFQKLRKKRKNTDKKMNQGIREASFEVIKMNDPKHMDFLPFQAGLKDIFEKAHEEEVQRKARTPNWFKIPHGTDEPKRMELLRDWDAREMEAEEQRKTERGRTYETYTDSEPLGELVPIMSRKLDDSFAYVGRIPESRDGIGFEKLKPQNTFPRQRRQDTSHATAVKDEVRRNITHVLGQFFSMMKKLGDSKSFYHNKENPDSDDVNWSKPNEMYNPGRYNKAAAQRQARSTDADEEEKTHPVADLNYLFLTVTLPTMLAFTLLLVICFFNLRVKGWLCTKLFKPRHVYVVEGDVEKAKPGRRINVTAEVEDSGKTYIMEEEITGGEKGLYPEKATVKEKSGDTEPSEKKTEKSKKTEHKVKTEKASES